MLTTSPSLVAAFALTAATQAAEVELIFQPSTLVEVAMFSVNPGEELALGEKYFSKVMPIAAEYGMKPLGTFTVAHIEHGDVEAAQWGFFQWPDLASKQDFEADRRFLKLVGERDSRLGTLKIIYVKVEEPTTVTLDDDRYYEIFAGWVNRHEGAHLQDYFAAVGPWIEGKEVQFHGSFTVSGQSEDYGLSSVPQMFGFMSWPNRSVKEAWFASDAFRDAGWNRAVALDRLVVLEGTPDLAAMKKN